MCDERFVKQEPKEKEPIQYREPDALSVYTAIRDRILISIVREVILTSPILSDSDMIDLARQILSDQDQVDSDIVLSVLDTLNTPYKPCINK